MADPYFLPSDAVAGTVYLSKNVDPAKDITISFEYACFGTELQGDEGFCVFFYDTYAKCLTGGGPGPGLCYTPTFGVSAYSVNGNIVSNYDGVNYGQLGIGFDLTGNFSTTGFGVDGLLDGVPNSITIRGSENASFERYYTSSSLDSSAFPVPFSLYQHITAQDDVIYRTVRIRLTDIGKRVIIDFKHPGDTSYTNYINTTVPETWSNSVNCCLGFTTGLTGACFSIKNFNINGIVSTLSANPPILTNWSYYGARYLGMNPNPATLTVKESIFISNAAPWNISPPTLVQITPEGAAPFQNLDGYVTINYGTSSLPSIEDSYCNRVGNIGEISREKIFNFIAQLIGWRMWGTMEEGWLLGSLFNAGSGTKAYALKSDTNYVELVSGDTQTFPLWEPNGIRLINDYNPSYPNNFGPRLEVPLWNKKISPPMSIVTIVKPLSTTQQGACLFGQTSYGQPAGTHFGINMDPIANFNAYFGKGSTINGSNFGIIPSLSSYYAICETTDGSNVEGYVSNYNVTIPATLTQGCILSAVGFGYDVSKSVANRQFDGQVVAGFVFNKEIDFPKFFEIYKSTVGSSLIFPSFP